MDDTEQDLHPELCEKYMLDYLVPEKGLTLEQKRQKLMDEEENDFPDPYEYEKEIPKINGY